MRFYKKARLTSEGNARVRHRAEKHVTQDGCRQGVEAGFGSGLGGHLKILLVGFAGRGSNLR